MFLSLFFWLALLLPGYALARLVDDEDSECGLMGMIGVAYLWAFALLSPVSILCYLLRLPVYVFSAACVAAVLGGVVVIHRRKWWGPLGRMVVAGVCLELVLVVVDLAFSARIGAFLSGDAESHVARIRFLLAHGFSNQGPFVNAPTFFWVYHTNIQHAMYAACSQLTGTSYLSVWYTSIVWAKLAIVGGTYYFAYKALRSRWAAWLPTLFLLVIVAPVTYLVYPNKVAPGWLLPIAMGFAIDVVRRPQRWVHPLKLVAVALVLAQVHSLYAFFMALVLGPIFAVLLGI
ncbi:MAG TPA: hypothetical protein P5572_17610, partial [Phycisphaerae bacterium]|nr:hypothetical protein [Phycisphaerae bacterium]